MMKDQRRAIVPGVRLTLALIISTVCFLGGPEAAGQADKKELRQAQRHIRAGAYDKAEKIYRKLLTKDHTDQSARLHLSFALLKQGRVDETYQQASIVAGQDPLSARAHALLGTALLRSGVFKLSIQELTTAAILDEKESMALASLAEIDFFENRSRQAYDRLRRATNLEPEEPDYWIAFGRAAARLELFKEAAGHYERFLSISPKLEREKRERYRGLIDFYNALARVGITHLHRVDGPQTVTLPFELQNSRPFLRVSIDGSEPLNLVIDTGASITVLSEKVARRLGIHPMAQGGRARAVGGGGTFPIVYGLVGQIALGPVKVYNVPIYIREFHATDDKGENTSPADGFLGLSVMSNFRLTLDYAQRELVFEQAPVRWAPESVSSDTTVVRFRTTNGGLVSAEVKVHGDEALNFLVDSGASATVLAEDAVERLNWKDKVLPEIKVRVLGAAGLIEDVDLILVPSLAIDGLEQRNIRAPVLDLDAVNETAGFMQSGILGGNFLRHFRLTFDFERGQLLMQPQTEAVQKRLSQSLTVPPMER
jgi:predicted aspartyl protease/Flp pilus assembly protein TadD